MPLKVLAVVDKQDTALDRLAKGVEKYHDNLDYGVVAVHPKRPDDMQLKTFEMLAKDSQIIDFQYYKTALMLLDRFPWLKDKKKVLSHYNPYAVKEQEWDDFDLVVGCNETIRRSLMKRMHNPDDRLWFIPLAVDLDFWQYKPEFEPNKNVIMVANRIEGKKGIKEVAIACSNLGLNLVLVGSISDQAYFQEVMDSRSIEFHYQISDEDLRRLYYRSTLHICNSVDNFESGTLPILEAMACGVPVLTRSVGHVPDLDNGENLAIYQGDPEDVTSLQKAIEAALASDLISMRDKAWNTVRNYNNERRAYKYQKLYRQLMGPQTPVSVIMPIYDKPEVIKKSLEAVAAQDYPNLELVICDDNIKSNKEVVDDFKKDVSFPVRYINCAKGSDDYGLARCRNMGAIEATGDILVFDDQRMVMEPSAVSEFAKYTATKDWLYGNKGYKKDWVENFSCVLRDDFIQAGMFNERMDAYGGLSQETRMRIRKQGFKTTYVDSAKATPTGKSGNRTRKKDELVSMKNRLFKMGLN